MNVPDDAVAFATQLPQQLETEHYGTVRFFAHEELKVQWFPCDVENVEDNFNDDDPNKGKFGVYLIPAVSFVQTCDEMNPEGLLLWLVEETCFGFWDSSHHVVYLAECDDETKILRNIEQVLYSSEGGPTPLGFCQVLEPWPTHRYHRSATAGPLDVVP